MNERWMMDDNEWANEWTRVESRQAKPKKQQRWEVWRKRNNKGGKIEYTRRFLVYLYLWHLNCGFLAMNSVLKFWH